jgi:hypothetical protein
MNKEQLVHLFHILIVGGLFLYVGSQRDKIPAFMYPILLTLGSIISLYHIYKAYKYMKAKKPYWINLIHIFIVGPLLVYIGYNREKTSRRFFEMLLMLAFAAIGYHGYYLVNSTNDKDTQTKK